MQKAKWKKVWRAVRIARREGQKAAMDMLNFGTGVIRFDEHGEAKHIPIAQVKNLEKEEFTVRLKPISKLGFSR